MLSKRARRQQWISWPAGALLALAILYTLGVAVLGKPGQAIRVGAPAPDFRATTLEGTVVQLSDYRGRGVLLNFWGSWCVPCVSEMPRLKEAYESGIAGVEILAVNVGESKGTMLAFAQQHGLSFPLLNDPPAAAAEAYRVQALPATFLITPEGRIKQMIHGELSGVEQIKSLLRSVQPGV